MPNRFFLVPDKGRTVVEYDLRDPSAVIRGDCTYFFQIVRTASEVLGDRGLDFYVSWDLDWLPNVGPNVVVILLGDERYLAPSYLGRVTAVFKTGGISPFSPYSPLDATRVLWAVDTLRAARDTAVRTRRAWKHRHAATRKHDNLFLLPIGYNGQIEVAPKAIAERTCDVLFAGQLDAAPAGRRGLPDTMTLRPREWSRASMGRVLRDLAKQHPSYVCEWLGYAGDRAEPKTYSEALANAKISLCPRGNFPETYRFCESARAGCAIVSEPLPPTWYFRDHPAVIIRHWRELPNVVERLLHEPGLLDAHHRQAKAWWNDVVSESAVGTFVADCLSSRLGSRYASNSR